MIDSLSAPLEARIRALRAHGITADVATVMRSRIDHLQSVLLENIVRDVAAFTASGNPDVVPELEQHLRLLLDDICQLLAGRDQGDFVYIHSYARRRAEQKFPLDAALTSLAGSRQAITDWIRDAAVASAHDEAQLRHVVAAVDRFSNEYLTTISALLTSEYVSRTRTVAESEGDRRTELLNILLSGHDESDRRAAQLLRRAGYLDRRQTFCIVVARSVDPKEMENSPRAQRMADAVAISLRDLPYRALIGIRNRTVVIVLSGTRRLSGWTKPQSVLADRLYPRLRTIGPAALIGISNDAPSTSHIPSALMEAHLALDFASVAERVMPYARIRFRDVLVSVAAAQIRSALPTWVPAFRKADANGTLSATLRVYANADMNVLKTAKVLSLHPNTIYARMRRIDKVTANNPLHYNALTELLLTLDCADLT